MADRNKGEKSTVRIARSSWEQNGYEQHRTLPVPVSSGGTLTASRSPIGDADRIWKPGKSFKRSLQIFLARNRDWLTHSCPALLSPLRAARTPSTASLPGPNSHSRL